MQRRELEGTLLFAIPTRREEFARDAARLSEFLLQSVQLNDDEAAAWARYEPYAALCCEIVADVSRRGIRVIRSATLTDLAREVAVPGVTTLVAHSIGRCVEFADGLWDYSEIDDGLPPVLAGTLDLTVCHSRGLAELLRRRRSTGVILASQIEAELQVRLALYRQTINVAVDHGLSYEEAALQLREHSKKGQRGWQG